MRRWSMIGLCARLALAPSAAAMLGAACVHTDVVDCRVSSDCVQGRIPGICTPSPSSQTSWCAFPDGTCPSGSRWGLLSGDDLGGTCVEGTEAAGIHILSVAVDGLGSVTSKPEGIDCGDRCAHIFADGSKVSLTATPASGQVVVAWDGDCASAGATETCTLDMSLDRQATVRFGTPGSALSLQSFGSVGNESVDALSIDSHGGVYVAGHFTDSMTIGATVLIGNGLKQDIFVAKFSEHAGLVWAKVFGSAGTEQVFDMTIDGQDNLWLVGFFSDRLDFGGGDLESSGQDGFVARLAGGDGGYLLAQKVGPVLQGVAVDRVGNAWVAGTFFDPLVFGTTQLVSTGGSDIFLVKLDQTGHIIVALNMGGPGNESPAALATDEEGNLLVTGNYSGTTSLGCGQPPVTSAGEDGFVAKLSQGGACQWAKSIGGAGNDNVSRVATDSDRNVYVVGSYSVAIDFGAGPAVSKGGSDGFAVAYDALGMFRWASVVGTNRDDALTTVTFDKRGNPIVGGTVGANLILGSTEVRNAGSTDGVALGLTAANGAVRWATGIGGDGSDDMRRVAGSAASGHVFASGVFENTAAFGRFGATSLGADDLYLVELLP